MTSPFDWKGKPSVFATSSEFNGKFCKKKTSESLSKDEIPFTEEIVKGVVLKRKNLNSIKKKSDFSNRK